MAKVRRAAAWVAYVLGAPALGVVAFFATAKVASHVAVLVLAAIGVDLLVAYALARIVWRRRAVGCALVAGAVFAVAGWALLFRPVPIDTRPMPSRGVAFEHWPLSTGSRVAVARFNAGRSTPIVFLHGGPGRPLTAADVAFFGALAGTTLDVIVFDQAGVGESDKLSVTAISLERAVADVDALREKIGSERIALVGQSWGGRLAYEYAVRHRDRVERMAVVSAAPISSAPDQWKFDERRTALAHGSGSAFPPALIAAGLLFQINPEAALSFKARAELDGLMAAMAPTIVRRGLCAKDDASVPPAPPATGLDAAQFLAMRRVVEKRAPPDIPSPPPSLVLRGECDYVAWTAARTYRDRLKATLVYVAGAGHALWPYQQDAALAALRAFFAGETIAGYEGDADPADASR